MIPNYSNSLFSVPLNCLVALHQFSDGEIWVCYYNEFDKSWVTLKKASRDDIDLLTKGDLQEWTKR